MQQTADNFAKIQDILFGEFKTATESTVNKLELNLNEQMDQIRAELKAGHSNLADQLKQLENNLAQQREGDLAQQVQSIQELTNQLDHVDGALSHQITTTQNHLDGFEQQNKQDLDTLRDQFDKKVAALREHLEQGKVNRLDMAQLLKQMAEQIET